jgi:triacylglycerol lipase
MSFEPRATSFSMANAQILAQAAAMAYREPAQCAKWATVSGFTGPSDFFDNADTQGFVAESGDAIIVAFRGTQPNRPMDWFVDARATRGNWDHNVGQVHDGFYNALRKVWGVALPKGEVLPKRLVNRGNKTIWITGHSLGGALAELCAAQAMFVSKIPVQGVYTFGQPRVGNKDFAAAVNDKLGSGIYRFVNDRDIVPRVPLFTMGFCHYGNQTFYDSDGNGTDAPSAVETLKGALALGKGAFNPAVIGQAAGLIADGLKGLAKGDLTEEQEKAFRERATNILRGGIEKIDDHDMVKHYLVRLGTSLPTV